MLKQSICSPQVASPTSIRSKLSSDFSTRTVGILCTGPEHWASSQKPSLRCAAEVREPFKLISASRADVEMASESISLSNSLGIAVPKPLTWKSLMPSSTSAYGLQLQHILPHDRLKKPEWQGLNRQSKQSNPEGEMDDMLRNLPASPSQINRHFVGAGCINSALLDWTGPIPGFQ